MTSSAADSPHAGPSRAPKVIGRRVDGHVSRARSPELRATWHKCLELKHQVVVPVTDSLLPGLQFPGAGSGVIVRELRSEASAKRVVGRESLQRSLERRWRPPRAPVCAGLARPRRHTDAY